MLIPEIRWIISFLMEKIYLLFMSQRRHGKGHSISEVKQNFAMGEDGLVRLSGYADGSDRYLAYAPLGINDWMICYVASVTVAQQSYAFVEKYEMVFLGCFGILDLSSDLIYYPKESSEDGSASPFCTDGRTDTGVQP